MIRDLYAEQLDDFGKPVRGGYEMNAEQQKPKPESSAPKSFAEAVSEAGWKQPGRQRKTAENDAATRVRSQKTPPAPQPQTVSDDVVSSLAKQLGVSTDVARKMASQPQFADQLKQPEPQIKPEAKKQQPKPKASQPEPPPIEPPQPPPPPPTPPPVENAVQEQLALAPGRFLANYGEQTSGQNAVLEDHLQRAGVFEGASADQLSQFAKMLGIPQAQFVTTPDQLRGAIFLNDSKDKLRQVLQNAGILEADAPPPSLAERARTAAGEFGEGFVEKSGLRPIRNIARAVGRAAKTGRFAATAEDDAPAKSWNAMTPLERAMFEDEDDYNSQQTYGKKEVDRLQAKKPGIEMPTQEIDNEDADEGDQLGLFEGTGKKNTKAKKFKLENEKNKAKQSVMFDRMNDHPDQKALFSTFAEAADHYAAQLKKK